MKYTRKLLPLLAVLSVLPGLSGCGSDDPGGSTSFTLTVSRTGSGTGTVSGQGITCGADCSETVAQGTVITLITTTTAPNTFSGWSGGGCSGTGNCVVTVNANTTVQAQFDSSTGADPAEIVALTTTNKLISFARTAPDSVPVTSRAITGLATNEQVVGIDFRPSDGLLYGLTNQSRVYKLDAKTGIASSPFELRTNPASDTTKVTLTGTEFGVDFNPTDNLLRIVSNATPGENYTVNVTTGLAVEQTDLNGAASKATAAAYTNNLANSAGTVLFVINTVAANDTLYVQDPSSSGTLTAVGSLGIDSTDVNGFEIIGSQDALVAMTVQGAPRLYSLNLATGSTTTLATINTGEPVGTSVRGIAAKVTGTATPAGDTYALMGSNQLVSFDRVSPATIKTQSLITGLQSGESILTMDFRPADGKLYALGNSGTGRLYTLNVTNGVATLVGALSGFGGLSGSGFGMSFQSTDVIRVVSNNAQNLSIDPTTGAVTALATLNRDGGPPRPAGAATSSAFTNDILGASGGTHYALDTNNDVLATIRAAAAIPDVVNNPVAELVNVGSLGVDAESAGGLDIDGVNGKAYAALNVAGEAALYRVNLGTGAVTKVGPIGVDTTTVKGLALAPPTGPIVFAVITEAAAQKLIKVLPTATNTLLPFTSVAGTPDRIGIKDANGNEIPAILGIDFRAKSGVADTLYAVTSSDKLFAINTASGLATPLNGAQMLASPDDTSDPFGGLGALTLGMDFDPTRADNIANLRISSAAGTNNNILVNAVTGEVFTDVDLNANGAPGTFEIAGSAFTNNFVGATSRQLFVIDLSVPGGALAEQGLNADLSPGDPSNGNVSYCDATLTTPLTGDPTLTPGPNLGFDIAGGHNGLILAALDLADGGSTLSRVSTSLCDSTAIGKIGPDGTPVVQGIAIQLETAD